MREKLSRPRLFYKVPNAPPCQKDDCGCEEETAGTNASEKGSDERDYKKAQGNGIS